MNRCPFAKDLSAYLDQQLPEDRRHNVEEHLASCKECAYELSQLSLLSGKLKGWQAPGLDASFDNAVKDKIVRWELQKGEAKMKKPLAVFVPAGALAAILFVVLVGPFFLKRGVQGRLRTSADTIGEKYSSVQYEPYYMTTDFVDSKGADSNAVLGVYKEKTRRTGYQRSYEAPQLALAKADRAYSFAAGSGKAIYAMDVDGGRVANSFQVGDAVMRQEIPATFPVSTGEGQVIVIQPVLPATGQGEMIIRTADVKLEVESGQETYNKALGICQELGGYVAQTRFYKDNKGREAGQAVLRIPKDKFMTALDKLALLGKVEAITTDSQDVSQEYKNLRSRLDAALVVYNKMLESLQKRQTTIPEAMRLESELSPILYRIEELKNRIETFNNLTAFTTVTLNFYESRVSVKVLRESGKFIQKSLLSTAIAVIKLVADSIPVLLTIGFWLILIAAAVAVVRHYVVRLFKR